MIGGVSMDRLPTLRRMVRRVAAALDPVGLLLLPAAAVAIAAMYNAVGDSLSFFGVPGDPDAGLRAIASGTVLLAVGAAYIRRDRTVLALVVGIAAVVPPTLTVGLPDTGYGLLAMWALGPTALAAMLVACVRPRYPRDGRGRPPRSASMDAPAQEP
jgi:hypothetical protein